VIRLVSRELGVIGEGEHRSGWPYVLRCLKPLLSANGILFDDFIEASFGYRPVPVPHREPWVGVFHQPHDAPEFLQTGNQSLNQILENPLFRASLPHLKLGITLSSPLGAWLQQTLGVPFVTLLHPTETRVVEFSETAFLANRKRRVIQVGWYLRNTAAIYQLEAPDGYTKTCLRPEAWWVQDYMNRVLNLWRSYNWISRWEHNKTGRRPCGRVENAARVPNDVYDRLLSENVVFIEFFSTAANNAVVECIVRNTPLVVNRLPALEEYLGKDYPLFFDSIEEAGRLFAVDSILAGHEYLKGLDKRPFTGGYFRAQLAAALKGRGLGG
jgi:hypothetical protein